MTDRHSGTNSTFATYPIKAARDPVYCNLDHELDVEVMQQLAAAPGELHAQHAAWDFCGYVWQLPDGRWVDQVWRHHAPIEDIVGDTVEDVISRANETYDPRCTRSRWKFWPVSTPLRKRRDRR